MRCTINPSSRHPPPPTHDRNPPDPEPRSSLAGSLQRCRTDNISRVVNLQQRVRQPTGPLTLPDNRTRPRTHTRTHARALLHSHTRGIMNGLNGSIAFPTATATATTKTKWRWRSLPAEMRTDENGKRIQR